jgi:DNA-binding SARP family transcriptional activator
MAKALWRIELFGALRACCGERVVTHFETRKIAALLACLALRLRQSVPRIVMAEQLWPDEDWDATRNRLRQALSSLRQDLEPRAPGASPAGPGTESSLLLADRADVRLNPAVVTTDVLEFEAGLRSAARADEPGIRVACLKAALALYHGELLPGYYEEWIATERERLAEAHRDALGQLAEALGATGDPASGIEIGRRFVMEDPLREDAHCTLMRLYARAGRTAEALRQYRDLERQLQQQLGAAPSAATRALFDELRGGEQGSRRAGEQWGIGAGVTGPLFPTLSGPSSRSLEPEGGAVPLGSPFYLERPADTQFHAAIGRGDSIVLVKGPRQIGKTSLLARGLHRARAAGARVVMTDLQKLAPEQMESPAALFATFAEMIADQIELDGDRDVTWNPRRGWNVNFERFLRREVLGAGTGGSGSSGQATPDSSHTSHTPQTCVLVWALDEVDRLFGCPYSNVVFGLFRSWHNERALNPDGPFSRLTLAIAYATEAHLLISDLNQSPFNVGTRLTLEDFTVGEVAELNHRYGTHSARGCPPLRDPAAVARFFALVGGHPYLVRRGLHEIAAHGTDLTVLEAAVGREDGIFGDHLRRMLIALTRDAELCEAVRAVLRGEPCPTIESFYRLRSAGVLAGPSAQKARPRCRLYHLYLARHLR